MSYQTPEQIAESKLQPLGCINQNQTYLLGIFKDKTGAEFRAMADFYHSGLGLHIEIKHDHLNGKTTKANAESAYRRIEAWRVRKSPTYYQTRNQWNHAAKKHAIVQSTLGRNKYVVAFTKTPDEETMKRIERDGVEAYSLVGLARILQVQLAFYAARAATH